MFPSSTPNKDIELALEKLEHNSDEEKIERLKKESDAYCCDCLTKKDKNFVPGVGLMCQCQTEDFMENGEDKYPILYKRNKEIVEALRKDMEV